jgi:hypothetical protein
MASRGRLGDVSRSGSLRSLFVPVVNEVYRLFESGEKWVELRQLGPKWNHRHVFTGRLVVLSRGYSTADRLHRVVGRVATADCFADLVPWAVEGAAVDKVMAAMAERKAGALRFFDPAQPVIAFEAR